MRDIKEVLRGYIPSGEVKEWDVTPDVVVDQLTFQDEGTVNGVFSDGKLIVNGTTDPSTIHLGVMKTNVGMSLLSDGDAYRFSIRLSDLRVDSLLLFGLALYPETMTPTQVQNEIITGLTAGLNSRPSPIFLSVLTRYSAFSNTIIYAKLNTDTQPNGQLFNAISSQSDTMDLDVGTVEHLFLRKTTSTLYVSKELVSSDGVTYDIYGLPEIANGVVFADNLRVYVFAGSIIAGGGLPTVHGRYSVEPTFDIVPVSRTVTGTTFANTVGNQTTFDSYFPNIKKPETITVTQKPFPIGVRPLELYKTKVVGNVSVPIQPYGITTSNNQLVLINNTQLGNESFTPFIDSNLLGDYLQPIEQQQANLVQSIADMGILIQQSANDVNKALINAGEMVVFVKDNPNPEPTIDSNVTFETFDEAYNYLVTFPSFIKKRIIIDDRYSPYQDKVVGTTETVYRMNENSIVLSTYRAFLYERSLPNAIVSDRAYLRLFLDGIFHGLVLDHFEGKLQVTAKIYPTVISVQGLGSVPTHTLLLTNGFFQTTVHAFQIGESPLSAEIRESSHLILDVDVTIDANLHPNLRVLPDETSSVSFLADDNATVGGANYSGVIDLYRESGIRADYCSTILKNLAYVRRLGLGTNTGVFGKDYAFMWQMNLIYSDLKIVRNIDDFGSRNPNVPNSVFSDIHRIIVIGTVDFGSEIVRLFQDVEIIGFAGSKIIAHETAFRSVDNNAKLTIKNCTLKQNHYAPSSALVEFLNTNNNGGGSLVIRDCEFDALRPIDFNAPIATGNGFLVTVDIQQCKFTNFLYPIILAGCNRLIARDLEVYTTNGILGGLFVYDSTLMTFGYKNFIDIDKIDIIVTSPDVLGNLPAILKLNTATYTPNSVISPQVFLNNITTIHNNTNQYYKEIIVYLDNQIYDYFSDTNFETEAKSTFALTRGSHQCSLGDVGFTIIGTYAQTKGQLQGFSINPRGLSCLSYRPRQYLVRVVITLTNIPSSDFTIFLKKHNTNYLYNPTLPDDPVTLDSEQILNQAGQSKTIEFNRVVTLSVLHTLTLDDRTNTVASNNNYIYNVAWYITEM